MQIDIELLKIEEDATEIRDFICRLGLTAKLDQTNTTHFELLVLTLIQGGIRKILLDMDELKYIDSSGIGKIINITKYLRKVKGNITITSCSPQVDKTLKLVKLDNFISFFTSNDEGFNYLKFI